MINRDKQQRENTNKRESLNPDRMCINQRHVQIKTQLRNYQETKPRSLQIKS